MLLFKDTWRPCAWQTAANVYCIPTAIVPRWRRGKHNAFFHFFRSPSKRADHFPRVAACFSLQSVTTVGRFLAPTRGADQPSE